MYKYSIPQNNNLCKCRVIILWYFHNTNQFVAIYDSGKNTRTDTHKMKPSWISTGINTSIRIINTINLNMISVYHTIITFASVGLLSVGFIQQL